MKRIISIALTAAIFAVTSPAFAVDEMQITYANGTVPGVPESSTGTLNTSSPAALEFHSGASQFAIPYTAITSYSARDENRFRLGVLPAIAVGVLKARSKRHFVTIAWKDEKGTANVVTFEMSHEHSVGLMSILRVRARKACVLMDSRCDYQ